MKLAIIIVSYNTRELLRRCLTTVQASLAAAAFDYRIIVVDNASHDATPAMLRSDFAAVKLIEPGANLGFAGGNNAALRTILKSEAANSLSGAAIEPDYILLLNPDTEVVGDAIVQLVDFLDQHVEVAVVGPRLRYPDGSKQPTRRRFPTPGVFFFESTPLESYLPGNRWVQHYRMVDTPENTVQDVDWLVGAALLVRRNAIERAGLFDEGFALYSEELEWQMRIQRTGGRIVFLPDALIIHHEGMSSEQAPARRYLQFHTSRLRYVRLIHSPRLALTLWIFLVIVYTAELLLEASKWLLGHRRHLRTQRIAVYTAFLRQFAGGG